MKNANFRKIGIIAKPKRSATEVVKELVSWLKNPIPFHKR